MMTKECEQKNQKNQPDPEKVFRAIAMIITARGEARVTVKSIRRVKRNEATGEKKSLLEVRSFQEALNPA